MQQSQLLKFDTDLFGFGVAKILSPQLSLATLQKTLNEFRNQHVRLVYWPSDSKDNPSQQAAKQLQGILCSEQITYLLDLKNLTTPPLIAADIATYQEPTATIELEQLAMQAGTYSRFKVDPLFPQELFIKLYRTWIINSVNGSLATRVIVIQYDNKVVGMATLGNKNARGDIGLIAVNANFHNQKFGTKLVNAAQAYFIETGHTLAQVVTQKTNSPACHLYEKCGFQQEKTENFYHFWL